MNTRVQPPSYQYLEYTQLAGALGAEVSGVQLNGQLDEAVVAELKQALLDFKVLFFRNQKMDEQGHADFARLVGTPVDSDFLPAVDGFPMLTQQQYDENSRMGADINFHHDDSFHKYPTKMSILRGLDIPSNGGDTVWVDQEKIYDSISEPIREMLEGMTVVHSLAKSFGQLMLEQGSGTNFDKMIKRNPPHTHPLVIRHPDTGRKCFYVNELLADHIPELSREDSDLLLDYICQKAYRPEFACRFRWETGSVAWWDNRNTVHRGIDDFYPSTRVMQRIAIADEQLPSLHPDQEVRRDFSNLEIVPCNSLDDEDAQLSDNENIEAEAKFLAELNNRKEGVTFTPEASARIKSIPAPFHGAALNEIFRTAENQGVCVIDEKVLDIVRDNR
jgi:taurine dioxygenase